MKGKTIAITIIITSIALMGVIVTQLFWVNSAFRLKNEQFKQNVSLGLKRVVNQLMVLQNDSSLKTRYLSASFHGSLHTRFIYSVDPSLVDSMISNEFRNLEVSKKYYYGIYNLNDGDFVLGNFDGFKQEIRYSDYNVPVSCIFQEDHFVLAVYFPEQKGFLLNEMIVYLILSAIFLLVIIGSFWFVIFSLFRQKKLSEMKNDFVNNMTHELKTPISTISVASEMLMNEQVLRSHEKMVKYARVIYDENQRLKKQVENVLQVAILDRGKFTLKFQQVDIHEIITDITGVFQITMTKRNGTLRYRLNAAESKIIADRSHIINVINNLLDNAEKYSPQTPEITVSTHSNKRGICISIEDKGIGMAEEHQKDIFKKFHRISTGNIHDVKGFGIGLFYVKTIVEAHQGTIKVVSEQGKGTKITLCLPFNSIQVQNSLE